MAVMLHPSKDNPRGYRVLIKSLGIQEYFNFSRLGRRKAKKLADERNTLLLEKRKIASLISDLGINRVFDESGKVRGLRRKTRIRKDRPTEVFLEAQITTELNTRKKITVSLTAYPFEQAYKIMQDKLLDAYKIERSLEIIEKFRLAKKFYW